jgi:WD40 repeat protein
VRPVTSRSKEIFLLDAAAHGPRLLVVGDGGCEVVDAATGDRRLDCGPDAFATLSPDGRRLVSFGSRQAELWDVDAGRALRTLAEQPGTVMSAAFSPDGKRVATGASTGSSRNGAAPTAAPILPEA